MGVWYFQIFVRNVCVDEHLASTLRQLSDASFEDPACWASVCELIHRTLASNIARPSFPKTSANLSHVADDGTGGLQALRRCQGFEGS